ncbi:MAG: DUF4390 domain-containing protein [Gammaproteobacteria bacterium]|nr:DUF4390 domain-containing protein [Gammaproteobacteria bacterium]
MKRLSTQILIMALLFSGGLFARQQDFADLDLRLASDEFSLLLQGDLSFHFSKAALEALANGLPLAVDTEVIIKPANKWYWQQSLASFRYKLEIQYHALSQQYLVKGIDHTYPRAFLTQSAALAALGRIKELALVELSSLDPDEQYEVSIRSVLDSESLPVPLRPLTYLSDEWRLRSGWKRLHWPENN